MKESILYVSQRKSDSSCEGTTGVFSVEELFDKVILLEKIERGIEQSRAGQVKDTAQAKEQLRRWLQ